MLCYLALVWNEADADACESAKLLLRQFQLHCPQWKRVVDVRGLAVSYHVTGKSAANEVYHLHGRKGVVLGRLFERSYVAGRMPAAVRLDSPAYTEGLLKSQGRRLIDEYWGAYVAFLRDECANRTWALRDPTGGVPCYTIRIRGVHVYFRRFEDAEQLAPLSLTVNQLYVSGYLAYVMFNRMTGFNEITHVLAGECVEHDGAHRSGTFYWNPLEISQKDVVEDVGDATELMRSAVRACVHAWASCHEGILHWLSGGLDSSIVLACLKDAPSHPRVVCENNYGAVASEDERKYARLMALRTEFPLVEREVLPSVYDGYLASAHIPSSCEVFHWGSPEAARLRHLQEQQDFAGLSVVFTGNGGDELFFAHGALPTLADYLYRHGIGSAWLRIALEDAQVDRVSLWRVLRRAVQYGVLRRPWTFGEVYAKTLVTTESALSGSSRAAVSEERTLIHPLYRETVPLPPGKIWHAAHLSLHAHEMHVPTPADFPESLPRAWPLRSQPLAEVCLRTPVYVLRAGGRDRAIARRAFRDDLPPEIVSRQWKVLTSESVKVGLLQVGQSVRELLLEGLLVNEGYLDPDILRTVLDPGGPRCAKFPYPKLLVYLDMELWLRSVSRARMRTAA